jgi:hypothetical protein
VRIGENAFFYARSAAVCAIALLSLVNVTLTIIGMVKGHSAVPYWDMWNGYLGFFAAISEGDWTAWWVQHNEHRILLARLLFWLDLTLFRGLGIFLLCMNFVLLGLIYVTFFAYLRNQAFAKADRPASLVMAALLLSWTFSWSQHENLVWAFQSQFLLAQLFPLIALFFQSRSVAKRQNGTFDFFLAVLFGMLSVGTMANGILILPLMVIYSVLTRSGVKRHALLVMSCTFTLWVYFIGYSSSSNSLFQALLDYPLDVIQYVLLYLGGAVFYLSPASIALEFALASGALLIIVAAVLGVLELSNKVSNPTRLALLMFLLYVGGTAVATASGRVSLGVEQALSSRYMTPALAAWAALGVLLAPGFLRFYYRFKPVCLIAGIGFASLMTVHQVSALNVNDDELYQRRLAFLAVELGIDDAEQLKKIFPTSDYLLHFSAKYGDKEWSVFGVEPFRNARNRIGSRESEQFDQQCNGELTEVLPIVNEASYHRVRGWIVDSESPESGWLNLRNQKHELVGIALLAPSNDGNSTSVHHRNFSGYMLDGSFGKQLRIESRDAACGFDADVPEPIFILTPLADDDIGSSATAADVQPGSTWLGTDSWRSSVAGYIVLGSWVTSDADTGSVEIRINRGAKIMYRSGPENKRQVAVLTANGIELARSVLPSAHEWSWLEFDVPSLPEEFIVKLSDEGTGWGEWLAIAVKFDPQPPKETD